MADAPSDTPQGVDVRAPLLAAMRERGFSGRSLARELQRRRPRGGGDEKKGAESWRNSLARYTTANEQRRQVPDPDTAALLADALEKPPGYFVRPQERKTARERALEEENGRLRQQVADYQRRLREGAARGGGGSP